MTQTKLNTIQLAGPGNAKNGYFYVDALAMYTNPGGLTLQDPENSLTWALRDSTGAPLYINYNIPFQMAADLSNPDWRSRLVEWILTQLRVGYSAMLMDDTNYQLSHLANAAGVIVPPVIGGVAITDASWAQMVTSFTQCLATSVKAIYPGLKIIHNNFWRDQPTSLDSWKDPLVIAGWKSADLVMKENGFADAGLTGGTGFWSLASLLQWCDAIHTAGRAVHVLETDGTDPMYSVACTFLMTNGADYWDARNFSPPPAVAAILAADLGKELVPRRRFASGLWTRVFENGAVLVNEPGAQPYTVGGLTLNAKQGMVYLVS